MDNQRFEIGEEVYVWFPSTSEQYRGVILKINDTHSQFGPSYSVSDWPCWLFANELRRVPALLLLAEASD